MKILPALLISILIVWPGESVTAQVLNRIGFRAGTSINYPDVVDEIDGKSRRSEIKNRLILYPELQAEWFQHNHLSLLTSISYISKGFRYSRSLGGSYGFNLFGGTVIDLAHANYLTFNVAPNFNIQLKDFTLYAFTGPYIGLLHLYDEYYNFNTSDPYNTQSEEGDLVLNSTVLGGTIGGGIGHILDNERYYISVQAQFMQDFTKTADYFTTYSDSNGYHNFQFEAKNKTLLLSLGLHYTFNKK